MPLRLVEPAAAIGDTRAQALMQELGAWTTNLGPKVRAFVTSRSLEMPPVLFRLSHPVRRALPTSRASVKVWEAYPPACSESGIWEVHIHPRETVPLTIVAAALAGSASAIVGSETRFDLEYGRIAARLGFAAGNSGRKRGGASWRNPVIASDSLKELQALADSLGPFPLGSLDASKGRRSADRNFLKAICPVCGPTYARLSRKNFETRLFLCGGLREAPHEPALVMVEKEDGPADDPMYVNRGSANRQLKGGLAQP